MAPVSVALLVGVREPARDPRHDEGAEVDRHRAAEEAVPLDELLDVLAADELHHHEVLPADLAEVVRLDDVGVDQVSHEPRLADEVLLELRYGGVLLADQFHGDRLSELPRAVLVGLVDDAHAALRYLADHFVPDLIEDMRDCGHRCSIELRDPRLAR